LYNTTSVQQQFSIIAHGLMPNSFPSGPHISIHPHRVTTLLHKKRVLRPSEGTCKALASQSALIKLRRANLSALYQTLSCLSMPTKRNRKFAFPPVVTVSFSREEGVGGGGGGCSPTHIHLLHSDCSLHDVLRQGVAAAQSRELAAVLLGRGSVPDSKCFRCSGSERERDLLQVPHFFVGTLQPL